MYLLVVTPGNLVCPIPSHFQEGIPCLLAHNWWPLFSLQHRNTHHPAHPSHIPAHLPDYVWIVPCLALHPYCSFARSGLCPLLSNSPPDLLSLRITHSYWHWFPIALNWSLSDRQSPEHRHSESAEILQPAAAEAVVVQLLWQLPLISKKHFRPGGMAPSEWTRSVRAVRDPPVADYSAPGVNTTRRVAHRPPIAVSPFVPQTLQEHSQMLLKAPAVMEVHSGRDEIWLLG